jgi:hypothetical protein
MIEMSIDLFYRETCFIAELTNYSLYIFFLLIAATIAVVGLLFGYFLQSITGQVKTCIALVAVEYLVRVVVETTKADLTVRLKKFFSGSSIFTFDWFQQSLRFY